MRLIEFIESYRIPDGADGGDYQWNDNHGRLIRCKDCKWWERLHSRCDLFQMYQTEEWYCANAELREEQHD